MLAQVPAIRAAVTKEVMANVPEIRKAVKDEATKTVKPMVIGAIAVGGLALVAGAAALVKLKRRKARRSA